MKEKRFTLLHTTRHHSNLFQRFLQPLKALTTPDATSTKPRFRADIHFYCFRPYNQRPNSQTYGVVGGEALVMSPLGPPCTALSCTQ